MPDLCSVKILRLQLAPSRRKTIKTQARRVSWNLFLKSPIFLGLAGDYGTLAGSRAHGGRPKKGGLRKISNTGIVNNFKVSLAQARVPSTSEIRSLPLNSEDLQNPSEFHLKIGKVGKFLRFLQIHQHSAENVLKNPPNVHRFFTGLTFRILKIGSLGTLAQAFSLIIEWFHRNVIIE